jgi:DUF4097 and DUF4098 domain-containing protein YvlB
MARYKELSQLLPFVLGGLLVIAIIALAFGRQPEKEAEGEEGMFSDLVDFFTGSEVVEENFLESVQTGAETSIDISHSHGNITVRGWDEDEVRIEGVKTVKAVDEETARMYAEMMQVEIESEGDTITVRTIRPKRKRAWKVEQISINYELYAPNRLKVVLENSHGDVLVENFAEELDLNTRHGNLQVAQIGQTVSANHEHGNAELSGIGGDALVTVRHGNLDVGSVSGELRLDHEHGNVELFMIGKSAELHKQHGSLTAANVGGMLWLDHQHGSVWLKMIEDDVEITKQHGRIDVETVKGNLSIDSQHTDLRITDIEGDVSLYGSHGDVLVEDVSGSVDFSRSHSKIEYVNVGGEILQ